MVLISCRAPVVVSCGRMKDGDREAHLARPAEDNIIASAKRTKNERINTGCLPARFSVNSEPPMTFKLAQAWHSRVPRHVGAHMPGAAGDAGRTRAMVPRARPRQGLRARRRGACAGLRARRARRWRASDRQRRRTRSSYVALQLGPLVPAIDTGKMSRNS